MKSLLMAVMLFLSAVFPVLSQPPVDSLKHELSVADDEETRVKILLQLGKACVQTDMNQSMAYIDQSIALSKKNGYEDHLADGYNVKGILYINFGKQMDAIACLDSAAGLFRKAGNKVGMASIYGNLGALYFTVGDYNKSLEYNLRCLKINEELQNKKGIAIAMEGVANVLFVQKLYGKSLHWYNSALKIHRALNDKTGEPAVLINMAMALTEMERYPDAMRCYDLSLHLADSLNRLGDVAETYFGMGIVHYKNKELDMAEDCFRKALEIFKPMGNQYRTIEVHQNLADISFDKKDYTKSIAYGEGCLADARIAGARQYARDALRGLYRCYAALGDYKMAYEHQSRFITLNDSILDEEKLRQIAAMQTQFETEKKESGNRLLMQENEIKSYKLGRSLLAIIGLAALLILAVAVGFLIIRQNRVSARQRQMKLEQKLLRSQMNPHFIFNSLIAIESFIYKNEPKEAGRYLSGFARLIRHILENSREEYISLSKEIQTLEHYLALQKLRYDENFDYTLEIDPEIDADNIAIPPMLAQPFIENSIEHGIKHMDMKGRIEIKFSMADKHIRFEVKDNGIGIERSAAMKKEEEPHQSLATVITKERLLILNRRKSRKIRFIISEIRDSLDKVLGTQVSFIIPYRII